MSDFIKTIDDFLKDLQNNGIIINCSISKIPIYSEVYTINDSDLCFTVYRFKGIHNFSFPFVRKESQKIHYLHFSEYYKSSDYIKPRRRIISLYSFLNKCDLDLKKRIIFNLDLFNNENFKNE